MCSGGAGRWNASSQASLVSGISRVSPCQPQKPAKGPPPHTTPPAETPPYTRLSSPRTPSLCLPERVDRGTGSECEPPRGLEQVALTAGLESARIRGFLLAQVAPKVMLKSRVCAPLHTLKWTFKPFISMKQLQGDVISTKLQISAFFNP